MSIQPPSNSHREISVTEPIGSAYERVVEMLFRPFDLGKWFVIGFCAWLARLGETGGYGFSGNNNFNFSNSSSHPFAEVRNYYETARDYALGNLAWLVPVVALVAVLVLALGTLFLWLNSRGKFMFLHCVALNKAEIEIPWEKYGAAANSLFWFRLALAFLGMLTVLPALVLAGVFCVRLVMAGELNIPLVMPVVGLVAVIGLLVLVFGLLRKCLMDFVVPIMYLRGGTCLAAWREFFTLLTGHAGCFVLYILLQIVLAAALGTLVVLVVLLTCCVAGCVMAIPYVGTVLLLPVLIFKRAFALYFLAQFGPQYDVFSPVVPPAAAVPPPGLQPV